jgi:serine/threonine-protein kinase
VLAVGTLLGRYRIIRFLGEGGMGEVYVAEHTELGRKVALKVLRPDRCRNEALVRRFLDEAMVANRVGNEHIVEVTDSGTTQTDDRYFVMELLVGETLAARLASQGRLPLDRALHVGVQIAEALHAAHSAGVVHRDLKPDNIFLITRARDPDYVKVLDFGIAKLAGLPPTLTPLTEPGAIVGTPAYMSPEQGLADRNLDGKTDVYSLGVMLYQLVSGELPFQADNPIRMVMLHSGARFPSVREIVPGVPESFERVLRRAVAKRPELRPDMCTLAQLLETIARGQLPQLDPILDEELDQPIESLGGKPPMASLPRPSGVPERRPGEPAARRGPPWLWWIAAGSVLGVAVFLGLRINRPSVQAAAKPADPDDVLPLRP